MASSRFDKLAAKEVLDSLKGVQLNSHNKRLGAAARRILDDQNPTKADRDLVKRERGYTRSGASSIKRAKSAFWSMQQRAQNYTFGYAALQTPNAAAGARVGLGMSAIHDAEELLKKSSIVKGIAKRVFKVIGKDPNAVVSLLFGQAAGAKISSTMALRSMRAGLRVGGAVAGVMLAGAAVAEQYLATRRERATAQLATYRAQREAMIDPGMLFKVKQGIDASSEDAAGNFEWSLNALGLSSSIAERGEKQKQQLIAMLTQARSNLGKLGVNTEDVLARGAAARGKTVDMLTERERAEILDKETLQRFDWRKYLYSDFVKGKMKDYEGLDPMQAGVHLEARRSEFAREWVKTLIETELQRWKDREEEAEKLRSTWTGAEVWQDDEERKLAIANFASWKSRQRVWRNY